LRRNITDKVFDFKDNNISKIVLLNKSNSFFERKMEFYAKLNI